MIKPRLRAYGAHLLHRSRRLRHVLRSAANDGGRLGCAGCFALGVALAAWLTLRPSGDLPGWFWLPGEVVTWVNHHGQLRNVPAYFILSLPAFACTPGRELRALTGVAVLAALLEFAQLGVAARHFDVWDILLSWVGIAAALVYYKACRHVGGWFFRGCHP